MDIVARDLNLLSDYYILNYQTKVIQFKFKYHSFRLKLIYNHIINSYKYNYKGPFMYTLYEKLLSKIAKQSLINRFIYTNLVLTHKKIPYDLLKIITTFSFRPSEILGRRRYYFGIIFNLYSIKSSLNQPY